MGTTHNLKMWVDPFPGWDELIACPPSVSQTGVGQTIGVTQILDNPITLDLYSQGVASVATPWTFSRDNGVLATGYLDGLVDGVWTPLQSIDFPDAFHVNVVTTIPKTGLLGAIRARAVVKAGAGTFSVTFSTVFYLIYKKQRNLILVPS